MAQAHRRPVHTDNVIPLNPPRELLDEPLNIDPVDALLGAWSSEQARIDVEPIAVTARLSRLAHVLQQCMERASVTFGLDLGPVPPACDVAGRRPAVPDAAA